MSLAETVMPQVERSARRFAIAWRNRVRRSIHDVAVLDAQAGDYRFQYLPDVAESALGFRPFIGFPLLDHVYESTRLWPFFDLRVMDRKRPDFPQWLHWLGLPLNADRLDILSRSGGEQKGDTVSLAEAPRVARDGATQAIFIVRGSGYAVRAHNSASVADDLEAGHRLDVVGDTTNEANPNALLLSALGAPIGWVPDLLISYANHVLGNGGAVTVLQNNGPRAPWHARLLVQITGTATPQWSAFTGGRWPALTSLRPG